MVDEAFSCPHVPQLCGVSVIHAIAGVHSEIQLVDNCSTQVFVFSGVCYLRTVDHKMRWKRLVSSAQKC